MADELSVRMAGDGKAEEADKTGALVMFVMPARGATNADASVDRCAAVLALLLTLLTLGTGAVPDRIRGGACTLRASPPADCCS